MHMYPEWPKFAILIFFFEGISDPLCHFRTFQVKNPEKSNLFDSFLQRKGDGRIWQVG